MTNPQKPDKMDPIREPTSADNSDPITATYNVFLNPSLPAGRRLLVLQHPNRTDDHPRPPPSELRLKSRAGMVEVDMPVDSATGVYDREKGLRWGRSLHASTAAKSGGSHGLAGGFGFGAVQQRGAGAGPGGRKKSDALDDDDVMLDWNEAVRQEKALTTQTLGGQYPDANDVQYMVGVFQGKNLHLTPVSSLVHLRPQLHHIDATTYLDRRAAGDLPGPGSSASAGGAAGAASSSAGAGAKAIHMTIKTTADGDTVTTETMADRLRAVQSESWRKMRYTDENEEAAWDVYNDSLFLRSKDAEGAQPQPQAPAGEGGEVPDQGPDLEESVPHFTAKWDDKKLLEAVSGITKPEPTPEVEVKPDPEAKLPPKKAKQPEEEPPRPRVVSTRTRGGAAGARRGGRAVARTG